MSNSSVSSGSRRPSSVSGSLLSSVSLGSTDCSQEPIVVYCDTCSKPLRSGCLTGFEHRSHKFKTIEEVCKDKMDEMEQQLKNLTARPDQGNIQEWVKKQEEQLKSKFQQLEDRLSAEYSELKEVLDHNMKQTFKLMENMRQGQKKTMYYQTEKGDSYKQEANNLLKEIDILKKKLSSDPKSVCIKEIKNHQNSIEKINEFYRRVPEKTNLDKSRLEALKESVQQIYGNISEMLPRPWQFYEDITFNPDNTDKSLRISPNGAEVCIGFEQKSPKNAYQTEETMVHILAKEFWNDGQHYWEVNVENCRTWAVGVVELASGSHLPQKAAERRLGWDKRSWMLESEDGELAVLHNNHLDVVKEQDVKRLGIFLDMTKNKNRLTFYNVGRNVPLHTFYPRFSKSMFPAFSLCNAAGQVQSLVLCNLNLKQVTELDSGADMSSRSSSRMSNPESLGDPESSGYFSDRDSSRSTASSVELEMTIV